MFSPDPPKTSGPARPVWTILLADDNEDSRDVFTTFFEVAGYRVLHAADGLGVLTVVSTDRPDVILLNLHMPELDGHGVLEELRAHPETENLPCLVLTGDARYEQLGRSVQNGADGFLTKPVEPSAVVRFVEDFLTRRGPNGHPGTAA
jgi:CheY-like chemotaxis protein